MTRYLNPYPAYRNSGVPWLEEVPDHWEVVPALAVYRPRLVKNTGLVEKVVLSLSYGHIVVKPEEKLHGLVPATFETYQVVDPGNIIVRTTDLQNDQTSLRVGYSNNRGIITSAYMCLETTDRVTSAYGYQFLNAYDLMKTIYGFGSGLRQNLDFGDIKRMPVLVPPKTEQADIVSFLNHADQRIRRLVRAKQTLIKLLEEQKQAIIHRLVTRGLDPDVRLKPSGVEWLGDVPEHWRVVRSGSMFRLFGGFAFSGSGFVRGDGHSDLPIVLTPVNFDPGGGLRFEPAQTVRFEGRYPPRFVLKPGDLVTVLTDLSSKRLILGRAGIVTMDGILLNQRTARIDLHRSARSEVSPHYLSYVLNTSVVREQVISTSRGSTVFHTSPTRMLAARWPIPPLSEQHSILEHLSEVERRHDAATSSTAAGLRDDGRGGVSESGHRSMIRSCVETR